MPTFQYKAKTRAGELVNGSLAAGDRRAALAELGKMGFYPLTVESAEAEQGGTKGAGGFRGGVKARDVLMFTQQLSSLLRSGMSLSQALGTLERRSQKKVLGTVLGELRNGIVQGESLSDSLAKHPKLFSRFFVNLIKAGEASGSLDDVLLRLAKHQEQMAEVREKVVGALLYPLIVVGVGICTVVFFMLVMVPRFAMMFKEMGRALPLPTRILIGVSGAFTSYWWIGVLLIVAGVTIYRIRARTPEGRFRVDRGSSSSGSQRLLPVSMYRGELRIVGGMVFSTVPAPGGKGAVRGLYIVTVPEGTASGRRVGDSGASWCRVVAAAPVPYPSLPDRPRRIGAWWSRSRGPGIARSR